MRSRPAIGRKHLLGRAILLGLALAWSCGAGEGLAAAKRASAKTMEKATLAGTPAQAGKHYGERFSAELYGFIDMLRNDRTLDWAAMRRKAAGYDRFVKKYTPVSSRFLGGVSRGAKIDRADLVTLLLHEEMVHAPHCTGVAAKNALVNPSAKETLASKRTSKATSRRTGKNGGEVVVGQTWDWPPRYAPFGGVVDYDLKGGQRVLSYHFPGLWSTSGINDKGLSLMWTGVGYYPRVAPKPGVPTYALISEILQQRDLKSALKLLGRIPNAGSFSFLLADQHGIAVAEATPGKVVVKQDEDLILRANHYVLPESKRRGRQRLGHKDETVLRLERVTKLARKESRRGKLDVKALQRILGDSPTITDYNQDNATIATMVARPARRELHLTLGGIPKHKPETYRLP